MATSQATRTLLGEILKRQLREMPLSRITVSGIAAEAGITRQAFYYHFSDVYDLAYSVFTTDMSGAIMQHAHFATWQQGLLEVFTYMADHKQQLYAVTKSLTTTERDNFFFHTFNRMMTLIVDEIIDESSLVISDKDRTFIIRHFALSILAHVLYWLATDMEGDPNELVAQIDMVLRGNMMRALTSCNQQVLPEQKRPA
ncbi:TetR/AcrR family transcriptional regulator C-terminal domain-containing protein [Arcanobacterium haemolyticum]|nr:TetR/AcrR family transcriptional regulator C-terminal domain-containing protein [Arcanobacterium haemolyticum]